MRNRDKHLRLSDSELEDLKSKARTACLTESGLIRMLVAGYTPVAAPDDRFYQTMEMIREFADTIDSIALKANNSADVIAIMSEASRWRQFQYEVEKEFLLPRRA